MRYLAKRVSHSIPTFIGALLFMFILVRVLPGDPARLIAGPEALEQDVQRIREQLGLDKPLYLQFVDYVTTLLRGDLGTSIKFRTPVINEIMARLPYTIVLALVAEAIAISVALPLGILSALRPNSKLSYVSSTISLLGASAPIFWVALMFIYVFSVSLRWLPSSGADSPRHIILPATTLALLLMGNLTRITRSSIIEASNSNHVLTAAAKGLRDRAILVRHVLKNAMIPIVTIMGLQIGSLLGGAIITETVYAWPGIGSLLIDAIFFRDYTLIQGIILFIVLTFIAINIIVDVVYALIDPRIRDLLWRTS
ncbi:MAG: ABC transporter permease [Sulfolobales archaeon]|nr:ABC transporter permease [Sulfolobales archaeon]MDW7969678.1 ABC transporter permease [Sulfolobales archaeon]